jgi:hypothetical protein
MRRPSRDVCDSGLCIKQEFGIEGDQRGDRAKVGNSYDDVDENPLPGPRSTLGPVAFRGRPFQIKSNVHQRGVATERSPEGVKLRNGRPVGFAHAPTPPPVVDMRRER